MNLPHLRLKMVVLAVVDVFVVFAALAALGVLQYKESPSTSVSDDAQIVEDLPTDFIPTSSQLVVPSRFATTQWQTPKYLNIPPQFNISIYVAGLDGPRAFAFDSTGSMYLTDLRAGKVLLIRDIDHDGVADATITVDTGLRNPHGIAIYAEDLYVAEEHQVMVYRKVNNIDGSYSQKELLITGLPTDGHVSRTIKIGPDQKIYLSIGSSCNVCEEEDPRRAAITRYDLDGTNPQPYATGLRNSVGMHFAPTGPEGSWAMWTVDNGRDRIGDDIPPEEVNIISAAGQDYGWPYCYGEQIPNPEYPDRTTYCEQQTVIPNYLLDAHSAPLGLSFTPHVFASETKFPGYLEPYLFITYHGSWNRTVPTGYKVVMLDTSKPDSSAVDFISGWLDEQGESWGRPVDIGFGPDGNMYISDDKAGVVYRVTHSE